MNSIWLFLQKRESPFPHGLPELAQNVHCRESQRIEGAEVVVTLGEIESEIAAPHILEFVEQLQKSHLPARRPTLRPARCQGMEHVVAVIEEASEPRDQLRIGQDLSSSLG